MPLLVVFVCLFEALYLFIIAISPLQGLHLSNSPVASEWQWTLVPSQILHSLLAPLGELSRRGEMRIDSLLLGLIFLALTGAYACLLVAIWRKDGRRFTAPSWLLLILGGTLIFGLTLFFQPMLFSDDVFTYIFSGRILSVYGADPLNTAPYQFPHDPYLIWVISGHDAPNIYGTLWLCISALLVSLGNGPVSTLLLFKGIELLAHLLNTLLVWAILGRIAPSRRLLGTLLYAWNPLVLIELAGSGHSEGVLMFLLLLATWCYVNEGARYKICAYLIFGLAISINLITLLLVPLYTWFDVRNLPLPQALRGASWRALLILIPALAITLPFWRGATTFLAITSAVDMEHFVHAPVGTLAVPTRAFFSFVAEKSHFPSYLLPETAADVTLHASATFIFILIYTHLFGNVRQSLRSLSETRTGQRTVQIVPGKEGSSAALTRLLDAKMTPPELDALLKSCGLAVFWYMILVSGWFWPWYMLWMFWIAVLRRIDVLTSAILLLSGTALFIYPFVGFTRGPIATYYTAIIFGIPLVYLTIARIREHRAERTSTTNDRRSQTTQA